MNPACERVRERHLELHPWRVTPEIDAHLEHCPECADHCARQERVARWLRSMPSREAPAFLWPSLQDRLEQDAQEPFDTEPFDTGSAKQPADAPVSVFVGELFTQLPYRSAPTDLWERVQSEIRHRQKVLWPHRPGSVRVRRWSRLARAAVILLPLLVGSYLLWNDGSPRSRKLDIIWTEKRAERSVHPSDPVEQVAFQLGDGSWVAGKR